MANPVGLPSGSYGKRRYTPLGSDIITLPGTLISPDKKYKYESGRDLQEYDKKLGYLFTDFRENLKNKKDVQVLDSGAGKGKAMVDLVKTVDSISKCVCITKHDFQGSVPPKIPKMEWVFARSEAFLGNSDLRFNMITDVFGAYSYSSERHKLIELYHNHLAINGRAFIVLGSKTYRYTRVCSDFSSIRFEKWLAGAYPNNFQYIEEPRILIITRTKDEELDLGLEIKEIRMDELPSDGLSEEEKVALDYYRPTQVDLEYISFSDE